MHTTRLTITKTLAICGIFAGLTLALTLISLPLPTGHGYIHLGDIPVLLFPLLVCSKAWHVRAKAVKSTECSVNAENVPPQATNSDNRLARTPIFQTVAKFPVLLAPAIGGVLADLLMGYVVYAPATLVIKAGTSLLTALMVSVLPQRVRFLAPFIACLLIPSGYLGYELLLFGQIAFTNVPLNALQGLVGAVGAWGSFVALRKVYVKREY